MPRRLQGGEALIQIYANGRLIQKQGYEQQGDEHFLGESKFIFKD